MNSKQWGMLGYLMGQRLRDMRTVESEKTPIAYSYNGEVRPKLPDVDNTVYPYAIMYGFSSPRAVTFFDYPLRYDTSKAGVISDGAFEDVAVNHVTYYLDESDEKWVFSDSGNGKVDFVGVWWANYDIYNIDGTLYKESSEPIPVYE